MPIIYLRHGEDERGSYKYDQHLTDVGKDQAKELAKKLLKDHGLPDIIYYSPYMRTRQTLKYFLKEISKYRKRNGIEKRVEIQVDPKLGRFFTKRERKEYDKSEKSLLKSSTLENGAIIKENKKDFNKRVKEQLDFVSETEYSNVWNITHTLVLLRISQFKNINLKERLDFLETIVIDTF